MQNLKYFGEQKAEYMYLGWPGAFVRKKQQSMVKRTLKKRHCHPVFLSEAQIFGYYKGYANTVLWPLFHGMHSSINTFKDSDDWWNSYLEVNELFAEQVLQVVQPGDLVWVHDYHLLAVPAALKRRAPDLQVGFFLHIPFPPAEVFRILPQRTQLLQSVLCSDLIGFHTLSYSHNFKSAVASVLGLETNEEGIKVVRPQQQQQKGGSKRKQENLLAEDNGHSQMPVLPYSSLQLYSGTSPNFTQSVAALNNTLNINHVPNLFLQNSPPSPDLPHPQHSTQQTTVPVGTYPIGIDPDRWLKAVHSPEVRNYVKDFRQQFGQRKVVLGVDRLDYTKGIPHKLFAFERFLSDHPEWVGQVMLVQIAVPTRTDLADYVALSTRVHELAGRINARFGTISSMPVHLLDTTVSFPRLCAIYHIADVALVTPVSDGMNLVAYEFVVCQPDIAECEQHNARVLQLQRKQKEQEQDKRKQQQNEKTKEQQQERGKEERNEEDQKPESSQNSLCYDSCNSEDNPVTTSSSKRETGIGNRLIQPGVLILSEFTGAASSLGAGCIRVNPWNVQETSNALHLALTMSDSDRTRNHGFISDHIKRHTAEAWATRFLGDLLAAGPSFNAAPLVVPVMLNYHNAAQAFKQAKHRLVILGLGRTLLPPQRELVENRVCSSSMVDSLQRLAGLPHTTVVVVTSRGRTEAAKTICNASNVWLSAENGAFLRKGDVPQNAVQRNQLQTKHPARWTAVYDNLDLDWMDAVLSVLEYYCQRTPGSYTKVAETAVSWHYELCDSTFATKQARELTVHLCQGPLAQLPFRLVHRPPIVIARAAGVSRELLVERLVTELDAHPFSPPLDFVACVGNFQSEDENVFTTLTSRKRKSAKVLCCNVGYKQSVAKYMLPDSSAVEDLLNCFQI